MLGGRVGSLDKRFLLMDKTILDMKSRGLGGSGGVAGVGQPMLDPATLERIDSALKANDQLQADSLRLSARFQDLHDFCNSHLLSLDAALAAKADKSSLLQDQQAFFDNLAAIAGETDAGITKLVGEELRKLSD